MSQEESKELVQAASGGATLGLAAAALGLAPLVVPGVILTAGAGVLHETYKAFKR